MMIAKMMLMVVVTWMMIMMMMTMTTMMTTTMPMMTHVIHPHSPLGPGWFFPSTSPAIDTKNVISNVHICIDFAASAVLTALYVQTHQPVVGP